MSSKSTRNLLSISKGSKSTSNDRSLSCSFPFVLVLTYLCHTKYLVTTLGNVRLHTIFRQIFFFRRVHKTLILLKDYTFTSPSETSFIQSITDVTLISFLLYSEDPRPTSDLCLDTTDSPGPLSDRYVFVYRPFGRRGDLVTTDGENGNRQTSVPHIYRVDTRTESFIDTAQLRLLLATTVVQVSPSPMMYFGKRRDRPFVTTEIL